MTYTTLICESCKKEIPRKSQKQKYCLPCSIQKSKVKKPEVRMKICEGCKIEYNAFAYDQVFCTKQCRKNEKERTINEKWVLR